MELVDHEVVPHGGVEVVAGPVERGVVVDDPVADGVRHLTRVRVDPPQVVAALTGEDELVLLAGVRVRDLDRPVAVVLGSQRDGATVPLVHVAGEVDAGGVRSPDPEGDSAVVGDGAHSGSFGRGHGLRGGFHANHYRGMRRAPSPGLRPGGVRQPTQALDTAL